MRHWPCTRWSTRSRSLMSCSLLTAAMSHSSSHNGLCVTSCVWSEGAPYLVTATVVDPQLLLRAAPAEGLVIHHHVGGVRVLVVDPPAAGAPELVVATGAGRQVE